MKWNWKGRAWISPISWDRTILKMKLWCTARENRCNFSWERREVWYSLKLLSWINHFFLYQWWLLHFRYPSSFFHHHPVDALFGRSISVHCRYSRLQQYKAAFQPVCPIETNGTHRKPIVNKWYIAINGAVVASLLCTVTNPTHNHRWPVEETKLLKMNSREGFFEQNLLNSVGWHLTIPCHTIKTQRKLSIWGRSNHFKRQFVWLFKEWDFLHCVMEDLHCTS